MNAPTAARSDLVLVCLRPWCILHHMSVDGPRATSAGSSRDRGRLTSLAPIVFFDIGGPLVVYTELSNNGASTVTALVLSGVLPAVGLLLAAVRHRRLDTIGALVLTGILVGTVLGLVTGSARAVLLEGSVPTALIGLVCLGSLFTRRPLMFRFAYEYMGHDTPKGRDFADRWRHAAFRRTFRVITVVWGIAYLAEAIANVVIVETQSAGTALSVSKIMPYAVAGALVAWMMVYGSRSRRKGERAAAARVARGDAPPPMPT